MNPVVQPPLEEKARRIAAQGGSAGPALRHVLGLLDETRREIDRLEALALEQQRRVCLGGVPKPSTTNWANRRVEIDPVHPDYIELARKTP